MSLQLPQLPNLESLRKQAKALHRKLGHGKLADAQHTLAQEYGFATWAQLKSHVESQQSTPAEALRAAVCDCDANRVRRLLETDLELRSTIDDPLFNYGFGQHALFAAVQRTDRATIEVLLAAGADIRKRTDWWAGGYGVLDDCDPSLVDFLVARGALLDAHSAARLGLTAELREFVAADPGIVHARGGDGQTPLHFASTVEVAQFLLDHCADIDALDVDHESTPAQYMLRVQQTRHYPRDRQDVARHLVAHGCKTDLLMAAALGDEDLVRRHLDSDPDAIRMKVADQWFPRRDPRAAGTIYFLALGANRTAHSVAQEFGHEEVFQLLVEHTPEEVKLELACELGDEEVFQKLFAKDADAARALAAQQPEKLPNSAQDNNTKAVRLMLKAGWAVDTPGEMGATALHWAAFNGHAEMIREILLFQPTLELKSREYPGTALSWAIFGSGNGWKRESGDYIGAVRALLEAGAVMPANAEALEPSDAVLEVLP